MADRYYVVLKATPRLREVYYHPDSRRANEGTGLYIARRILESAPMVPQFEVVGRPAAETPRLSAAAVPEGLKAQTAPARVRSRTASWKESEGGCVASLEITDRRVLERFNVAIRSKPDLITGGGADLPFFTAEHWCPRAALDPIFDDRSGAERLIGIDYLRDVKKLTGRRVNVVIVDQGVSKDLIEDWLGGTYGGGWPVRTVLPGTVGSKHGMMIARNVLRAAPRATIFDLPVLPDRIGDIDSFLNSAQQAFIDMLDGIAHFKNINKYPGSWIIVNAWAIFNRMTDLPPPDDYSNNPMHAFNQIISRTVGEGHDVVFCAGNCGQFCPDERCGPNDRGPGDSIYGANSHPDVVTLGAVRTDTMWLGYSSQGPGQPGLATRKPDLCASSQFRETDDAHMVNTGTSAACAMTAGAMAGLRSKWNSTRVPPGEFKRILNEKARKTDPRPWNERTGNGILDGEAAFAELLRLFP